MDRERQMTIVNHINFHAPVGSYQYITSSTVHFHHDGEYAEAEEIKEDYSLPSHVQFCRAIEKTMNDGLWWASTAWAVVFRVYQMKGYQGSIRQFVREIKDWEWKRALAYPCTYDGIQKPIVSGKLAGPVDRWKEEGVMEQMQKLGMMLLNLLN